MIQLLLPLILVGFALLSLRWFLTATPQAFAHGVRRLLIWAGMVFFAYLTVTGRLGIIVPIIGALIAGAVRLVPVLLQFLPLWQRLWRQYDAQRAAGSSSEQSRSKAEAKFLRMHLDHRTGEIRGSVLVGRFSGRDLKSMTIDELLELYADCVRDDQDSAALLEAYLDRVHGEDWRQRARKGGSRQSGSRENESGSRDGAMTPEEAYEILGLAPGASREAIIEAHRRLIQKVHPDRGGSDYLAVKINRAKDVLLGR
jgi:hypothetical protein